MSVKPKRDWGGEGILGCTFGYGILHRIPKPKENNNINNIITSKAMISNGFEKKNSVVGQMDVVPPPTANIPQPSQPIIPMYNPVNQNQNIISNVSDLALAAGSASPQEIKHSEFGFDMK